MQDVTSILKEINLTHVIISLIMYLFSILSLTRQRIGKHRVDLKKSSHYDAIAHTPLTEGGHSHHLLVHAIICIKSTSHCSFTHPTATTTCSPAQPPPRREVSNGLLTRPATTQESTLCHVTAIKPSLAHSVCIPTFFKPKCLYAWLL